MTTTARSAPTRMHRTDRTAGVFERMGQAIAAQRRAALAEQAMTELVWGCLAGVLTHGPARASAGDDRRAA